MSESARTYNLFVLGSEPVGEDKITHQLEIKGPEGELAINWSLQGGPPPMPILVAYDDAWEMAALILPVLVPLGRDPQPDAVMAALATLGFTPSEEHRRRHQDSQLQVDRELFADLRSRRPEWVEGIKLVQRERPE